MAYRLEQDKKTGKWLMQNGNKTLVTYTPEEKGHGTFAITDGSFLVYTNGFSVGRNGSEQKWADRALEFFDLACKYAANNDDPAMEKSYSDLVKRLADEFHPDISNKYNETALHIAARWGRVDAMKTLIKHGAFVGELTTHWWTSKSADDYLDEYVNKTLLNIFKPEKKSARKFLKRILGRKNDRKSSSLRVGLQTAEYEQQKEREAWKKEKIVADVQRASLFSLNRMKE